MRKRDGNSSGRRVAWNALRRSSDPLTELKANGPDILEAQRHLLTNELALVPRFALGRGSNRLVHDGGTHDGETAFGFLPSAPLITIRGKALPPASGRLLSGTRIARP